jgi:hypothetical protein
MKKIIYTIIIFITLTLSTEAQWVSQPLPFGVDVYDMKFFDANTGMISAHDQTNGYVFRTTNGGNNWVINSYSIIFTFQKINDSIIYGQGNMNSGNAAIFRSNNRGLTWDSIAINSNAVIRGISFINKDTGWVSGFDGNISRIWKTTNSGLSFVSIPLPGSIGWGKIFFLKYKISGEYYGWCSEYGDMWKTTNSGTNWFLCGSAGNLQQLELINERIGWASNASTNILKTTDGGLNWVNQPMPISGELVWRQIKNFRIIDSNIVYGDYGIRQFGSGPVKGIIWKTTNGGNNWGFQQPDTNIQTARFEGIDFVDSLIGWSRGIHTTNGGGPIILTEIISNINNLPKSFSLKQNYPNPFNPQTTIEFSIKNSAYVTLKVFDITGKEVINIINNLFLNSGVYKSYLDFNKTNLSSGTYFYRIQVNDKKSNSLYSDTKKMTYIK